MSSPRRAIAFSLLSQYGVIILNLATTMVVSRLLLPEEVGVYSIAAALVAIAQSLRDFGSSEYIVQEKELNNDRIRAAFTVTLAISWILAGAVYLAAPWMGRFYQEPGITDVAMLMAVTFMLLPFGSITSAYHRRNMNFKPMMLGRLGGVFCGSVVTIVCAAAGLSYMSMAWGGLVGGIVTLAILTYFRPVNFPKLPGFRDMRRVLSYGGRFSLIGILEQVGKAIPEMVVGKSLGLHDAGVYSRTNGITDTFAKLILGGVAPVSMSQFAARARTDQTLRPLYLTTLKYMTVVAWPFYGFLAIYAEQITLLLFGSNWLEVAPLLSIISLGMLVYHLSSLAHRIFAATGHINLSIRFSFVMVPARIVVISAAALESLHAVAVSTALLSILRFSLLRKAVAHVTGIRWLDYGQVVKESGFVAVATVTAAYLMQFFLSSIGEVHLMVVLGAGVLSGGTAWLIGLFMVRHPFREEILRLLEFVSLRLKRWGQ